MTFAMSMPSELTPISVMRNRVNQMMMVPRCERFRGRIAYLPWSTPFAEDGDTWRVRTAEADER